MYSDSIICYEQTSILTQVVARTRDAQSHKMLLELKMYVCFNSLLRTEIYNFSRICCDHGCTETQLVAGTGDVQCNT